MVNSSEQTVFHLCICADKISSKYSGQHITSMEDRREPSTVMVLIGMNGVEHETLLIWFPYYLSLGEDVSFCKSFHLLFVYVYFLWLEHATTELPGKGNTWLTDTVCHPNFHSIQAHKAQSLNNTYTHTI